MGEAKRRGPREQRVAEGEQKRAECRERALAAMEKKFNSMSRSERRRYVESAAVLTAFSLLG